MNTIRLAGTVGESIVDGPGIRFVIFAQGCPHHCPGCHNPQTFDVNGGYTSNTASLFNEIKKNPILSGVTFSGGEPFLQAQPFTELAEKSHEIGLNVMVYTGYVFEYIVSKFNEMPIWQKFMENIDILVDGPFEIARKNPLLKFRGSENQRIIDVKESLKIGYTVDFEKIMI